MSETESCMKCLICLFGDEMIGPTIFYCVPVSRFARVSGLRV